MKVVYNKSTKKYELSISPLDKCSTCVNNTKDRDESGIPYCPLLQELETHNVLIKGSEFYKTKCKMYSYYVEPEVEKKYKGMYLGDLKDLGYEPPEYDDKYKYK